jgi:hypothetical protein
MRALILLALVLAAPQKERPLSKVDRTKAVGAPVLDEKASEGIHVWLEDGWFNVAAVSRSKQKRSMTVTVRSTKKLEKPEGDFNARTQGNSITFSASVGEVPVKSRFKTEGDVTVTAKHPLFVGPLSQPAASSVSIGRY